MKNKDYTARLDIRMTPIQKKQLKALADKLAQGDMSYYIRMIIFGCDIAKLKKE